MADPYIGEIRAFPYPFAPLGWLACEGQSLTVQQYSALYAVIGNQYGGNNTVFNLPDLRGKAAMDQGSGPGLTPRQIGSSTGVSTVTLGTANYPLHTHALNVCSSSSVGADLSAASTHFLAKVPSSGKPAVTTNLFQTTAGSAALQPDAVDPAGVATVVHDNMHPYLPVKMCIAWSGVFPSKS